MCYKKIADERLHCSGWMQPGHEDLSLSFGELSKVVPFANFTSYTRLDCTDEPELKLFVFQIHISHLTGESPKAADDSEQQIFTSLAC